MRLRTILLLAITTSALVGFSAFVVWPVLVAKSLAAHQQSVTAELANWGREHSTIRDANEASRALEMLEYIQHYYVVAPGYSSDPETDARLEAQRDTTMHNISSALDRYIAQDAVSNAAILRAAKLRVLDGTRWEAK